MSNNNIIIFVFKLILKDLCFIFYLFLSDKGYKKVIKFPKTAVNVPNMIIM